MVQDSGKKLWFYVKNNQQQGPIEEEKLFEYFSSGQLDRNTLIWSKGMINWEKAENIPQFEEAFLEPPPLNLPPEVPGGNEAAHNKAKPKGRPWIRYLAKMVDLTIFSLILGFCLGFLIPDFYFEEIPEPFLSMLILIVWVIVEPICLVLFGNTLGRALLKTKIVPVEGEKIDLEKAYKRTFGWWARGLGLGIPIVNIICALISYGDLQKNGVTPWDKKNNLITVHRNPGVFRIVFAIATLVLTVLAGFLNFDHSSHLDLPQKYATVYKAGYYEGLEDALNGYLFDSFYDAPWRDYKNESVFYEEGYYAGYMEGGGGNIFEYLHYLLFIKYVYHTFFLGIGIWIVIAVILIKRNRSTSDENNKQLSNT